MPLFPPASSGGISNGAAFPVGPATNDLFYRSDRDIIYFYDGTRWLSATEYSVAIANQRLLPPYVAAFVDLEIVNPGFGEYDIYVTRFQLTANVSTTTAGNYYVCQMRTALGAVQTNIGSTLSTQNIALNSWVALNNAPNVVVPSTEALINVSATETGTCSAVLLCSFKFRYVG
ncbi:MAG: hypothetical protein V4657_07335 [Pseudomonadota bacterium]